LAAINLGDLMLGANEVERIILLENFFVISLLPAGPVLVCGSLNGR
jgi:hypothetical protein